MRQFIIVFLLLAVFSVLGLKNVHSDTVPYQLSFISPIQTSSTIDDVKGIRYNFISGVNSHVSGLDFGMFNIVDGDQRGLQLGLYNSSFKSSGVQIGLVNKTEYLNGIQLGVLNLHTEGKFPVLPILSFAF